MINLTIFCSGKNDLKPEYVEATQNIVSRIDIEKYRIVYGRPNRTHGNGSRHI